MGTRGFGDALTAIGDPAKFAQALAGLAPAARETALAIQGLRPAFAGLRLDVQQRLFTGLGAVIGTLAAAYLPVLRTGLGGIATALNTTAHALAGFLAAPQSVADLGTILGNVRAALGVSPRCPGVCLPPSESAGVGVRAGVHRRGVGAAAEPGVGQRLWSSGIRIHYRHEPLLYSFTPGRHGQIGSGWGALVRRQRPDQRVRAPETTPLQ